MCDIEGCTLESVALVDVTFPPTVMLDASTENEERPTPVVKQRIAFCIPHANEYGLTKALTAATAVEGSGGTSQFPTKHALNNWSWTVT